jgi:hypothetical protein
MSGRDDFKPDSIAALAAVARLLAMGKTNSPVLAQPLEYAEPSIFERLGIDSQGFEITKTRGIYA